MKFCKCCNTANPDNKRKCIAKFCRGNLFRPATKEELKADKDHREEMGRVLEDLLNDRF